MADPTRYLLPTERMVIKVRRHWALLVGRSLQSLLLFVVGVLLARIASANDTVQMFAIYFCVFVAARWAWIIADWYVEKLVVTDKRVLLLTGIVTRKVAIMPLVKVTDLTYNRSATGLMLGYGQFVVETAGQDQALSTIDYVPKPERLYIQISELLFGGDTGAPGALVTAAQREAEEEAERAARRRWLRFSPRRRRRDPEERWSSREQERPTSRLDDILARRDTLLADRDDPDWIEPDQGVGYSRDREPGDRRAGGWDEPAGRGARDSGWDEPAGPDRRDSGWDDIGEPTVDLPRFHEPPRAEGRRDRGLGGDAEGGYGSPPPREPGDGPTLGSDPADD
jgi:hypothetical protein